MSGLSPIITTPSDPNLTGSGTFQIGNDATFFFFFTDIDGIAYDPSDIDIVITDPDGETVKEDTEVDKLANVGVYGYVWTIPTSSGGVDLEPGVYTLTVNYVAETTSGPSAGSFSEDFIVIESGKGQLSQTVYASRALLETYIQECQRIPVYDEPVRFNNAKTIGKLTFPRWNQPAGANVYLNGNLIESGYTVDYLNGQIIFAAGRLSSYDRINVDYNFRWFTDSQLDDFIFQGIQTVNIWPTVSFYSLNSLPAYWLVTAEHAAAVYAIRSLMFSLQFQQPAKVFGGMDRAKDVFSNLETIKKNYESMLMQMLEQKKFGPYAGLTKTLTVPEFAMPGGRSRWFRYLFKGA